MSQRRKRIQVSLVVFPECDPSIIYGVFDTLWFAGIQWVNGVTSAGREPLNMTVS